MLIALLIIWLVAIPIAVVGVGMFLGRCRERPITDPAGSRSVAAGAGRAVIGSMGSAQPTL